MDRRRSGECGNRRLPGAGPSRRGPPTRVPQGALSLFDPVWDALFPKEQARILRLLVERVGYDGGAGTLAVTFRPSGIKALAQEVEAGQGEVGR